MNKKLYDQILTRWGSNACLNQWLKPNSLCYRHQPNLPWLWRFHCIISRRLKWNGWIKKMGNVLMSCYFSVLILAICKKCRLVLASEAPSSPSETKEDVLSPIAKEKRDVCTSFASSPSITKEDVPFKVQQAKAKVLSAVETDETDSVICYYHQNQRQVWNWNSFQMTPSWDLNEKKNIHKKKQMEEGGLF